MKIKIFLFLFQCCLLPLSWSQSLLESKIDFFIEQTSVTEALDQLSEVAQLNIAYSSRFFSPDKKITLELKNQKVKKVLNAILETTSVRYNTIDGQVILFQEKKASAKEFIISGYVEESSSGEKLISASIFCEQSRRWILSNEYGYYSLRLPEGKTRLRVSYLGCEVFLAELKLRNDQEINFALTPSPTLAEVVVTPSIDAKLENQATDLGETVPPHFIGAGPSLAGENDILRTIQLLPGVQSGADGFGGLYVRGGSGGQNLMLLDGAPVYNPLHLLGVFSIYNTSAIRSARFMRGAFPARYGGRLSSVFDVYTKDGNRRQWQGEAELGFLSAKASVEGPLFNKKGALFLAGRRSHFGFLLKPALRNAFSNVQGEEQEFNFYDLNAKLNYTFSKRDRLLISFYKGGDNFNREGMEALEGDVDFELEDLLKWGNTLATVRWNHLFNPRLFSNTIFTYSVYSYRSASLASFYHSLIDDELRYNLLDFRSRIEDWSFKTDFDFLLSPQHHLRFGGGAILHQFQPFAGTINETVNIAELDSLNIANITSDIDPDIFIGYEGHLYVEDEMQLSDKWSLNLGLRLSAFNYKDEFARTPFVNFEPRINTTYAFHPRFQVDASFGRMVQYIHLAAAGELRSPSDIWVPSDEFIPPETSWLGELGCSFSTPSEWQLSVDVYYKRINNIIKLIDGFAGTPEIGQGEAYGLEWMLKRQIGKTGGWFNYTLSWAKRSFLAIDEGASFPYEYDSRHQIKLFLYHKFNPHWTVGANWVYQSPHPRNIVKPDMNPFENPIAVDFGKKNAIRSIANHRLDLSLSYHLQQKNLGHEFKLSLYNVYNRKNIAFHRLSFTNEETPVLKPIHVMPFMPSLQYKINF